MCEVTLIKVDMSFWNMVKLMIKWSFAAIPAMIIMWAILAAGTASVVAILSVLGIGGSWIAM